MARINPAAETRPAAVAQSIPRQRLDEVEDQMIESLNHIGISVSNLERSIAFYRDLFGMELVLHKPFAGQVHEDIIGLPGTRGQVAILRRGGWQLELFQFAHPPPRPGDPNRPACDHGITHFCLRVKDVHGEYERLEAAGVRFHCPPQTYQGRVIATYGRDPDGNIFELLELIHTAAEPQATSESL